MKLLRFTLIFLLLFSFSSKASHITGGEMFYEALGHVGNNVYQYRITLILFRDEYCVNCADLPTSVTIGIYNEDNNTQVGSYLTINAFHTEYLQPTDISPCVTNPPNLKYSAGHYAFNINLPLNARGYTAAFQTCCRINGIHNISNNTTGATYKTKIPGTNNLTAGLIDSSPRFSKKISVVCFEKPFTLDFSAVDPDGDSLTYSLCSALGGGMAQDASFNTPAPPPYHSVTYSNGFTGRQPLGTNVTISNTTGIISGIAPQSGRYVVSVCVDSYRNGQYLATHMKDFILIVAPCDQAGATLEETYIKCDDYTFTPSNLNNSPLNDTYHWDFGVPGHPENISTAEYPSFTYPDTGVYQVKLVVNKNMACSDSTTAIVKVYPGFRVDFTSNTPICKNVPVQFRDNTAADYGNVNFWRWDFGNVSATNDTSRLANPTYTYSSTADYNVMLIAGSDKGCMDTLFKQISIVDKPAFSVSNDTLICSIDTLQLQSYFTPPGNVRWEPNYNITNVNAPNPLVSPDVSTTYIAYYSDSYGCATTDTVRVNVISHVTMQLPADTTICLTDSFELPLVSDALRFEWSPTDFLSDPSEMNPIVTPTRDIAYTVRGTVGGCFTDATIRVHTVPYPVANAGTDQKICLGSNTTLQATGGSIYKWRPVTFLNNPDISAPEVIAPTGSMRYIVEVKDVLGCPKPVYDTVLIQVVNVQANAGPSDTSIVVGQPLRLSGSGGLNYNWSPSTGLSDPGIRNPLATGLTGDINYILTVTNDIGCSSNDTIHVKVFNLLPDIYVPDAFTPDGDGLNDVIRPIPIGMKSINVFKIYNRWGELLFIEKNSNMGWNGTFHGKQQAAGSYVYYTEGVTYNGKKVKKKGTILLIK